MFSRRQRLWVRLRLGVGQNRLLLLVLAGWLIAGAALFRELSEHLEPAHLAILRALTLVESSDPLGQVYVSLTRFILFGVVGSVIIQNVTSRYRPEETSRALAAGLQGHTVVIGYTHFGRRVVELVAAAGKPLVVVHADRSEVDLLIRQERAVVLGDGHHEHELRDAGVPGAALVVLATDDVAVAAQALHEIRKLNRECDIIVRCPNEDVGDVLSRTYGARVVSTSKMIADHLSQQAERDGVRTCLVLGDNSVGRRVVAGMRRTGVDCHAIELTDDPEALRSAGVGRVNLIVIADDDLGANLIRVDRLRKLDDSVRVVCRVFHEDSAAVLTQRPFRCSVISSSRFAVESLVRQNAFAKIGIAASRAPKRKPSRS